jgi:hypothetical protein
VHDVRGSDHGGAHRGAGDDVVPELPDRDGLRAGRALSTRATERTERAKTAEESKMSEAVNHPKHYNAHPSGVECIQVVEHMTFNVGNAIKYLWRAGLKGSAPLLEDLKKARWYLDREIQRVEAASHA